MKFGKLLILTVAAVAGYAIFKARTAAMEPGDSGSSFYSNINGPGSLGETFKSANAKRHGEDTHGASPPVDELLKSDSVLINAAAKGDERTVEKRLLAGARADSRDALRRTPLMYASWNANKEMCLRLLAAGANPELKDRAGNNAFDYASGRGQAAIVAFLLNYTHSKDEQHYAQYAHIMQATLASDPAQLPPEGDRLASIDRINPEGQSPLHIAASGGASAMMEALIARGADVNVANDNHQTPLLWAAWNNQAAAAKLLIAHKADIAKADLDGNTPLMMAAQSGSAEATNILLAAGADRYAVNRLGKNAAILAQDKGHSDLAKMLQ